MCAEQLLNDPALFRRALDWRPGFPCPGPSSEMLVDEYLGLCCEYGAEDETVSFSVWGATNGHVIREHVHRTGKQTLFSTDTCHCRMFLFLSQSINFPRLCRCAGCALSRDLTLICHFLVSCLTACLHQCSVYATRKHAVQWRSLSWLRKRCLEQTDADCQQVKEKGLCGMFRNVPFSSFIMLFDLFGKLECRPSLCTYEPMRAKRQRLWDFSVCSVTVSASPRSVPRIRRCCKPG